MLGAGFLSDGYRWLGGRFERGADSGLYEEVGRSLNMNDLIYRDPYTAVSGTFSSKNSFSEIDCFCLISFLA